MDTPSDNRHYYICDVVCATSLESTVGVRKMKGGIDLHISLMVNIFPTEIQHGSTTVLVV